MKIDLSDEALEFGQVARAAIESAGGDQLVEDAEAAPTRRGELIAPVLAALGAWDLDVRRSVDELEAAASLCRSAGWWGLPYPVAERLSRPRDLDVAGLSVIDPAAPRAPVAGLAHPWGAVTLDGRRSLATPRPGDGSPRKDGFVVALDLVELDDQGLSDVALALTLPCWTLLGMLDRSMAFACTYALERKQFGQQLASFQGLQFQITEAEVERAGLDELAKYTLWSVQTHRDDAVADALALRLAAIEAADLVFRTVHQVHGAIGFCDETTLSWVSRYSQPLRRFPFGHAATQAALVGQVGTFGLAGMFDGLARAE
jgi:Acyl-CoA dehydrogenase, C-terminal domain